MLLVIALGGNALLQRNEKQEACNLIKNVQTAAKTIAALAKDYKIILCYGNGPQVGLLALQSDAYKEVKPYPLDILGAESQGMIGYLLQQAIFNCTEGYVAPSLLTSVIIDSQDPAFQNPTKPIGPFYTSDIAENYIRERGWQFIRDKDLFRRVVPSPEPQEIIELSLITRLSQSENIIICGGGGGVPVIKKPDNTLEGIEAVIDKDLTASKIAISCNADVFLILTDVSAVYTDWNTPQAKEIRHIASSKISRYPFEKGSMGPKIKAACQFVDITRNRAIIGSLTEAKPALDGKIGTTIYREELLT